MSLGANQIGQTIHRLLDVRRMKPSELARQANVDQGQLSRILRGISYPSIESLSRIANALGVSAGYLLEDETGFSEGKESIENLTAALQRKPGLQVALRSIQKLDDKDQEKVLSIINQVVSMIDRAEEPAN